MLAETGEAKLNNDMESINMINFDITLLFCLILSVSPFIDTPTFSRHTGITMFKKTHSPVLVAGVSVMVTVFVITCVIGLTTLIIKRDLIPTYYGNNKTLQIGEPVITK